MKQESLFISITTCWGKRASGARYCKVCSAGRKRCSARGDPIQWRSSCVGSGHISVRAGTHLGAQRAHNFNLFSCGRQKCPSGIGAPTWLCGWGEDAERPEPVLTGLRSWSVNCNRVPAHGQQRGSAHCQSAAPLEEYLCRESLEPRWRAGYFSPGDRQVPHLGFMVHIFPSSAVPRSMPPFFERKHGQESDMLASRGSVHIAGHLLTEPPAGHVLSPQ